jgi:signal transduction histidine kinase
LLFPHSAYFCAQTIVTLRRNTLQAAAHDPKMKQQYLIIPISLFFLFIQSLRAQEAVPPASFSYTFTGADNEDSINVHTFAGVGHDSSRERTIHHLLSNPNALSWQVNPPKPDYYTYNWACFRLINATKDTVKRYMWVEYSFDYLKLYKIKDNVLVDSIIRGRFPPLSMKYALNHQRTFYIELLPQSQTDYYFNYYFDLKRSFRDSIFLLNPTRLQEAHQRRLEFEEYDIKWDDFLFNFLFILVFMTIIQYYIFPRNFAFLYYIGYLFFIFFYYFNYNNIYYRFYPQLDGLRPYFYLIEIITSYGCYAFYNLFIMQFSDAGKSYPPLIKIARFFNILWLVLIPIHCLLTYYVSTSANHYLFIGVRIVALIISFYTFYLVVKYGKSKLNAFLYIGTTCLLFFVLRGTFETITELLNFYPNNWFNNLDDNYRFVGIRLGVLLESICFSIGLIFKGKQLAKEQQLKELALQKQYIEQLEKTQKWQEKYQTELKQEIAIKAGQLAYMEREQAIERTRSQIAQDIHDEVGGRFTKISLAAELASRQPELSEMEAKSRFEKLGEDARHAANTLREIIFAINPDYDNFAEMQAYFLEFSHNFWLNTRIESVFDFEKNEDNPIVRPDVKRQLLLIFKEAQNNVAKHAQASVVFLTLKIIEKDHYLLQIKDNGHGFDPLPTESGQVRITGKNGHSKGFSGMKKRADSIDAIFTVESVPNQGTTIRVEGQF